MEKNKTIELIIPHWKEDAKVLFKAISSINSQVGFDRDRFKLTICTDFGGNEITEDDFLCLTDYFDLNFRFLKNSKHTGPGGTRQYALDRSNSDYVMFMDSDDVLSSNFVLKYFFNEIDKEENEDLDCIFTGYVEEFKDENGLFYIKHDDDVSITCLHGKLYKREFLNRFNIRFPNFMVSEDGAFNFQVISYAENIIFNDDITSYIWKFNEKSITRKNNEFVAMNVSLRSFKESIRGFDVFFKTVMREDSKVIYKVIPKFIESLKMRAQMLSGIPTLSTKQKEYAVKTIQSVEKLEEKYKKIFKKRGYIYGNQ